MLVWCKTKNKYVLWTALAGTLEQGNQILTPRNTSKPKKKCAMEPKQSTVNKNLPWGYTEFCWKAETNPFDMLVTTLTLFGRMPHVLHIRNKFYITTVTEMLTFFQQIYTSKIIEYIRELRLFDKFWRVDFFFFTFYSNIHILQGKKQLQILASQAPHCNQSEGMA